MDCDQNGEFFVTAGLLRSSRWFALKNYFISNGLSVTLAVVVKGIDFTDYRNVHVIYRDLKTQEKDKKECKVRSK